MGHEANGVRPGDAWLPPAAADRALPAPFIVTASEPGTKSRARTGVVASLWRAKRKLYRHRSRLEGGASFLIAPLTAALVCFDWGTHYDHMSMFTILSSMDREHRNRIESIPVHA